LIWNPYELASSRRYFILDEKGNKLEELPVTKNRGDIFVPEKVKKKGGTCFLSLIIGIIRPSTDFLL